MTPAVRRTDQWPMVSHLCDAYGHVVSLKFRGACASGAEVFCDGCNVTFRYEKPVPSPSIPGQESGGRTHF